MHDGSLNVGSGNTPWRKNDVRAHGGRTLIEYKRTDRKSITIKLADIEDLRRNALLEGRDTLFGFEIGGRDYVIVEAADYEQQLRLIEDYRVRESPGAGARLGTGQVPPAGRRPVLSRAGTSEQGVADSSEGRVPGKRRVTRMPRPGGLS